MDVPDWFVEHLKRTGEWGEPKSRPRKRQVRESDSESDKDVMRAFRVKPVWGWLIMKGIKDVENRWNGVQPPKGVCAVSFSKTYGRAEHEELLEYVDRKNRKLIPPFEELKKLCGKVVGIVGYEVRTSYKSKWWNGEDFAWVMSNPRWIDKPFAVKGFIGMWTMKPADAKKVMAQL